MSFLRLLKCFNSNKVYSTALSSQIFAFTVFSCAALHVFLVYPSFLVPFFSYPENVRTTFDHPAHISVCRPCQGDGGPLPHFPTFRFLTARTRSQLALKMALQVRQRSSLDAPGAAWILRQSSARRFRQTFFAPTFQTKGQMMKNIYQKRNDLFYRKVCLKEERLHLVAFPVYNTDISHKFEG